MRALAAALMLAAMAAPALAASVKGEWARVDGKAHVRIAPCGDALCGTITWLPDAKGPAKLGQKVFYDMKPDGADKWAGSAFNPDDGRTYSGKMTFTGAALNTAGCIMGGLICKSVDWQRVH